LWPKLLQGKKIRLFAATCCHSKRSPAKPDFGHTRDTTTRAKEVPRGTILWSPCVELNEKMKCQHELN
jgi:hypothetical protein